MHKVARPLGEDDDLAKLGELYELPLGRYQAAVLPSAPRGRRELSDPRPGLEETEGSLPATPNKTTYCKAWTQLSILASPTGLASGSGAI